MAEHEFSIGLSSEWRTPKDLLDKIGLSYGIDPCSPREGPCYVPAQRRFTVDNDGLLRSWSGLGLAFVNPPFGGRYGQVPWVKKFLAHDGGGILLVAARTSCNWWHALIFPSAELICFPNGKTRFIRPDGSVGMEPGTGIALIGAGKVACNALRNSGLGACVVVDRIAMPSACAQKVAEAAE